MFCSLRLRRAFLISGVTVLHLLVLLGLIFSPPTREELSVSGNLLVDLMDENVSPSSRQKFSVAPNSNAHSKKEAPSVTAVSESNRLSDGKGIGHGPQGKARQAIYSPKPHYPLISRQLREQGLTVTRICVNELGVVEGVDLVKSSGFERLDRSALNALAQWQFSPVAENSYDISLKCFQAPIQFTLEG